MSATKIFDEYEGFYNLLRKRVGEMPEYADWAEQYNLPQNITVAYESIKK